MFEKGEVTKHLDLKLIKINKANYTSLFELSSKWKVLLEKSKPNQQKYIDRAEYMLIKLQQLIIIDKRIKEAIKSLSKSNKSEQELLHKLYLDYESFFYVSTKYMDLFFEGMNFLSKEMKGGKGKEWYKILQEIRNRFIEHSHKEKFYSAGINEFGFNKRYGPYTKRFNENGFGKRAYSTAYVPLKQNMINGMHEYLNLALNELKIQ